MRSPPSPSPPRGPRSRAPPTRRQNRRRIACPDAAPPDAAPPTPRPRRRAPDAAPPTPRPRRRAPDAAQSPGARPPKPVRDDATERLAHPLAPAPRTTRERRLDALAREFEDALRRCDCEVAEARLASLRVISARPRPAEQARFTARCRIVSINGCPSRPAE
ncbi:MAG: hypothetical protein R3F65_00055 [bacterium]